MSSIELQMLVQEIQLVRTELRKTNRKIDQLMDEVDMSQPDQEKILKDQVRRDIKGIRL
tara:strand:+ start:1018 stop:1194 length:177 start_codon:yes stop_codon:yes gene_type:complete